MALQKDFINEVYATLKKTPSQGLHSDASELHKLPEPLRLHLLQCGYGNVPLASNFYIHYERAAIKLKQNAKWLSLDCHQFNSYYPPTRLALMLAKLYGLIPFSGRDKYQHGNGNMHIKLAGFSLANTSGEAIDISGLSTYLAEAPLLPAAFLQGNLQLEKVSPSMVVASMTDNLQTVKGAFHFDAKGQLYRFSTSDRFYTGKANTVYKVPWSTYFDAYRIVGSLRIPLRLRAVWHMPDGDFEYYRCNISKIDYNLKSVLDLEV